MKKLMIALSAATAVALGAKADQIGSTVTFTEFDKGDVIAVDAVNGNDTGFQWKGEAGDSSIAVDEESNKYLKIDTTNPLQRTIKPFIVVDEQDTDGNPVKDKDGNTVKKYTEYPVEIPENGGNVTISSKVQFTAADEAPTAADGDKLLVWMQAADAEKEIAAGVMVTDKTGATMIKEITDVEAFTAAWHTLAIKAVAKGDEGEAVTYFTVTLDGEECETEFQSLVSASSTAATTIASIGFKGTGAVDDIAFAANDPVEAEQFTVVVTATGTTDFGMGDNMDAELAYDVGTESVDIYVGIKAGEVVTCNIEGASISEADEDGYVTVTISTASIEANATVSVEITVKAAGPTPPSPIVPTIDPSTATVNGIPEGGFKVGTEYTVADITATPSSALKRATVVIKINSETVTAETFTLKAGDEVTIEVTEADITFELTIPTVTGATAAVTAGGETVADITKIVKGTEVTVTWTADEGYKITAGATETITMSEAKTAAEPTVKIAVTPVIKLSPTEVTFGDEVYDLPTVTLEGNILYTLDVDYTYEWDKKLPAENPAEAVTLTVTVTMKGAYTGSSTATFTVKPQQGGETLPNYLKDASDTAKEKYAAWAKTYGADTESANEEAFLLNCAPTKVKDEAAKFAITAITVDADGNVTVETVDGADYNGVIVIKGSVKIGAEAVWHDKTEGDHFFKAVLEVEKAK